MIRAKYHFFDWKLFDFEQCTSLLYLQNWENDWLLFVRLAFLKASRDYSLPDLLSLILLLQATISEATGGCNRGRGRGFNNSTTFNTSASLPWIHSDKNKSWTIDIQANNVTDEDNTDNCDVTSGNDVISTDKTTHDVEHTDFVERSCRHRRSCYWQLYKW